MRDDNHDSSGARTPRIGVSRLLAVGVQIRIGFIRTIRRDCRITPGQRHPLPLTGESACLFADLGVVSSGRLTMSW